MGVVIKTKLKSLLHINCADISFSKSSTLLFFFFSFFFFFFFLFFFFFSSFFKFCLLKILSFWIAGDILKLDVEKTWEFDHSHPIRSMVLPYAIYGLPLKLLQFLESHTSLKITPYLVVVTPRLAITLLMFAVDIIIWKACKYLRINPSLGLTLYASSFVTLTFLTRTLSNTIECLFFAVVLLIVIQRLPNSSDGKKKKKGSQKGNTNSQPAPEAKTKTNASASSGGGGKQNAQESVQSGQTSKKNKKKNKNKSQGNQNANKPPPPPPPPAVEDRKVEKRTEERKAKKQQPKTSNPVHHIDLIVLAACLAAGTFNRPTFPIFCLTPILLWLYHVSFHKPSLIIKNSAILLLYTLPFCVAFVVGDSLYYRTTLTEFNNRMYTCVENKHQQNMMMCVWNTVTHSVAITPFNFILYNIQGINLAKHGLHPFYLHIIVNMPLLYGILYLLFMYNIYRYFANAIYFNNTCWLSMFVIVPVDILTIFPHQESRFLVPLLPVMILIGASVMERHKWKKAFAIMWIVSNVALAIFYGVLHQGGLVQSLFQMQKASGSAAGLDHVVFYHTYMPPRHLLLNRKSHVTLLTHDLQGSEMSNLHQMVASLQSAKDTRSLSVVLPSTVANNFKQTLHTHSLILGEQTFGPHLSLEDPPPLFPFLETSWDNIQKVLSHLHLKVLSLGRKEIPVS